MAKRSLIPSKYFKRHGHKYVVFALVVITLYVAWRVFCTREYFDDSTPATSAQAEHQYKIVYVYSASCQYCKQFDPIWKDFQSQVYEAKLTNVKLEKSTNATKYKVQAFPAVLILEDEQPKATFNADRTVDALWTFLRANMNS